MKIILLLLIASSLNIATAQIKTYSQLVFKDANYEACVIKIDTFSLKKFSIIENTERLTHADFINKKLKDSTFFIINASINDDQCKPLGYYVNNSVLVNPINLNDGAGNFYLKPNGVLLIMKNEAVICESTQLNDYKDIQV